MSERLFQFRFLLCQKGEFALGFSVCAFSASAVLAMFALWIPWFDWRISASLALGGVALMGLAAADALDHSKVPGGR